MGHKKNYRDAYKWSVLALLLFALLPIVLGGADAINQAIANTEITAAEINSDADLIAQPTENPTLYKVAAFVDDGTLHQAEQSVFWNANDTYNEMIINTGATTADNASNRNRLYFNWNISAQDLLEQNINKIVISLKGVNANTTIRCTIRAINNGYIYTDSTNAINLLDITNLYAYKEITLNNTTAATITINLDPAILKYAADHTSANNSHIGIGLVSADPVKEFFNEGQTIYFRIYAEKPHGGLFTLDRYDFIEKITALYGMVFLTAAIFATGYVNPTHKRILKMPVYGIKKYLKHRRKQKYIKAKRKLYGSYRRPRRYYNRRYYNRRWR